MRYLELMEFPLVTSLCIRGCNSTKFGSCNDHDVLGKGSLFIIGGMSHSCYGIPHKNYATKKIALGS